MEKLREILEELQSVLAGRGTVLDSLLPPVVFVILNAVLGMQVAIWAALGVAAGIAFLRLFRRQSLRYALGGAAGVALAVLIAQLLGRAEGFFLPGIITGGLGLILCLVTVVAGRPIVAYTSHLARRWPLDWYWHPQVRPAYSEVTWLWVLVFGLRLLLQVSLFQNEEVAGLAVVQVLTGWPVTIALLIVSYLYGTWRLRRLRGPSVREFETGAQPPWDGQRRGF